MTRDEIIREVGKFFDVEELVCDHIFAKWGEKAWQFLDTGYLEALLVIRRDIIRLPMYCNGRNAHQRGMRCNLCQLVKEKKVPYVSSHLLGKAGDFSVPALGRDAAAKARALIRENASLLPCPIRVEGGVSWLHFDTLPQTGVNRKVYEFRA